MFLNYIYSRDKCLVKTSECGNSMNYTVQWGGGHLESRSLGSWFLVETQLTERTYLKESISSPRVSHVMGLGQRITVAIENVSDHRTTQYYKIG